MAQGTHFGGRLYPSILMLQIFGFSLDSIAIKVSVEGTWDILSICS